MSDQQLIQDIEKTIRKAALDGTLTSSAISEFDALIKESTELRVSVKSLETKLERLTEKHTEFVHRNSNLNEQLEKWKKREEELEEREAEMTRLELEARYDRERVEDHKEMFRLIFRNIEVRRNVFTPVSGGEMDQYGQVSYQTQGHVQENTQTESTE